jgi:hypothetical protein
MTQQEIKTEAERYYAAIKEGEEGLKLLRRSCEHPTTFEGTWSWRVGSLMPAVICSDCGKLIKYL